MASHYTESRLVRACRDRRVFQVRRALESLKDDIPIGARHALQLAFRVTCETTNVTILRILLNLTGAWRIDTRFNDHDAFRWACRVRNTCAVRELLSLQAARAPSWMAQREHLPACIGACDILTYNARAWRRCRLRKRGFSTLHPALSCRLIEQVRAALRENRRAALAIRTHRGPQRPAQRHK